MAGETLNIKVCSPLKLLSGLIGNYHAICHYSYQFTVGHNKNHKMDLQKLFYQYSKGLTEMETLSESVSKIYFEWIIKEYPNELKDLLLSRSESEEIQKIILYLWYTSELILPNELKSFLDADEQNFHKIEMNYQTPEPFYNALVWQAARAHPTALTGGYFGYWKYIPEN